MPFDTEKINTLVEEQLLAWPLAATNFAQLRETARHRVALGALDGAVQCNPARIVSTGARVDKASIESRPCFLCSSNRPKEQFITRFDSPLLADWELLVNPFPILPIHFTIVSKSHVPQSHVPYEIAAMAEELPEMAVFFNGARAGASAPDHLHLQAVLSSELPLLRFAEQAHPANRSGFMTSMQMNSDLPFQFVSAVVTPDEQGMNALRKLPGAFGIDADTGEADPGLVNIFAWIGSEGLLRLIVVPRRRHRPRCYGAGENQFIVSPGAIDMAGLMIAPRREDFDRIGAETMGAIYADVAFADSLPDSITSFFLKR